MSGDTLVLLYDNNPYKNSSPFIGFDKRWRTHDDLDFPRAIFRMRDF